MFVSEIEASRADSSSENETFPTKDLLDAIYQMARVAKPGGWVIAVESIGDQPLPINHLFRAAGLYEESLAGAPADAFCYRKPTN